MSIPFEPKLFGITINIHLVLEYFAFFISYRYYVFLRKQSEDKINNENRLQIILGAAIGAFLGSRIFGYLENPIPVSLQNLVQVLNAKTIMGGLFGGLIGVEISKKIIKEKESSGDLFVFPIILGIFIGRIGCLLTGIKEFTYGKETRFFMGMNLGDGLYRHPLALYELLFLAVLFLFLKWIQSRHEFTSGTLFKSFMVLYFSFRFFIEFLKPNTFFVFGWSSLQCLSVLCVFYYFSFVLKMFKNAYQRLRVL